MNPGYGFAYFTWLCSINLGYETANPCIFPGCDICKLFMIEFAALQERKP